jgi:trimeric autotransporter adhesin
VLAANYTYTGTTTIASRVLSADKKSVILNLTGNEAQQASATVKVENVKSADGYVVAATTNTVTFFDATVPSVVSATLVGPTKVQLKFSEPVTATALSNAAFSLDNNTYSLSGTPTLVAGTLDTIEITLGTILPAGSHTIKVNPSTTGSANQVKDFAGFVVPTTDVTFNYAQDTTAPAAILKSASQTQAVFEFEDAVQFAGTGVLNTDFTVYHTYNNQGSYKGVAVLGADNKTLTVTFAAPIPEGNVNFFLNNTTDASKELEDAWGNKVVSTTFSTTVAADKTAPTVTKVEKFDGTHIDVTFSEAVTGVATGDFTLTDAAGNNVSITGVANVTGNTYRLTTAALNGNTYKLKVAADSITDTSINLNKIAAYETTFVVADTVAPTVTGTGSYTADGKKVFVKFSEAMATSGAGSVLDVNNYRFTTSTGLNASTLPANTTITLG